MIPMFKKEIDTQAPLHRLIIDRWSGRAYDPDKAVERTQLLSLLEAARWAPSCFGAQPWRYVVCDKNSNEDSWQRAFSCLAEGNQSWAVDAPLLILSLANTIFSYNNTLNRWAKFDTGAANMSLCVQATALGLMVHQMGGFDMEKSHQLFNVPQQYTAMSMIAVGYQLAVEQIPATVMERESATRTRVPLTEICFDGKWEQPLRF